MDGWEGFREPTNKQVPQEQDANPTIAGWNYWVFVLTAVSIILDLTCELTSCLKDICGVKES